MSTIEELSQLSDEELRILCAELLGWSRHRYPKTYRKGGATYPHASYSLNSQPGISMLKPGVTEIYGESGTPPQFSTDLNAMHEAEKTLSEQERADYADELFHLTEPVYQTGITEDGDPEFATDMFKWLTATARQRCIAFIAANTQS